MKIWFFIFLIFITESLWAWTPLTPYKVRIRMKDGSLRVGFIEGDSPIEENSRFDPNDFLKSYLKNKPGFRKIELYDRIYSINDNGKFGDIAFMKEEEVEVEAEDVKKMEVLKSPHVSDELKEVPVFSRTVINIMQKKLIFCDAIGTGSAWEYVALNYNPKIGSEKVHQLLSEYMKSVSKIKNVNFDNEVLSSDQIIFTASYSD